MSQSAQRSCLIERCRQAPTMMANQTSDDHTVARYLKHLYSASRVELPRGLKPAAQKNKQYQKTQNCIAILGLPWFAVIILALPLTAYAQSKQPQPSGQHAKNVKTVAPPKTHRRASPITRWVPASTKLFIRVRELDKVDISLQHTHAWQLLPLIAGQPIKANHSFAIRDALVSFLGIGSGTNTEALAKSEIGIVATSWLELPHAVWIVKLPGVHVLDEWFPKATRVGDRKIGLAQLFRTRTGLSVCARGQYVALARRGANQQALQRIRSLMVTQSSTTKPLSLSKSYRELMTYLPGQDIAHAYFSLSGVDTSTSGKQSSQTSALARLEGAALVGMFDRGNHIDFTFRLAQSTVTQTTTLADDTLERMAKLPSTTIAAVATTFDFAGYYDRALAGPPKSAARRYLQLLQGLGRGEVDQSKLIESLGPDVLVVWDSDTHEDTTQLHLAVMVKCSDAQQLRTEFTYLAANLLRVLQIFDPPDSSNEPTLKLNHYLGLPYIYIDWPAYSENAKMPTVQQFKHTSPAWAAWGDWFVFALDRDHLERIVDARYGLRDTIEDVVKVSPLTLQKNNATIAALVRTGLAARYVQAWLGVTGSSNARLLASSWWSSNQPADTKHAFELGFSTVAQDEDVVVQTVDEQSSAAGLLQAGDRIRGVDGSLLSLTDPVSDLTSRLTSKSESPHRIRLQRGGQWMEVELPIQITNRESGGENPIDAVIIALREFTKLGQTIQEMFIAIHAPNDHTTAARLTIKLKPHGDDHTKSINSTITIQK